MVAGLPEMKLRELPADQGFEVLTQRGCGAWVGDHGCGVATKRLFLGQTELFFATYLNAHDPSSGTTYALLCERHGNADDPAAMIADMAPAILSNQRRELRKAFRLQGRRLGKPNLLQPE